MMEQGLTIFLAATLSVFIWSVVKAGNPTTVKIFKNVLFGGLTLGTICAIVAVPLVLQWWYWEHGSNMEWLAAVEHDKNGNLCIVAVGIVAELVLVVLLYNSSVAWYLVNDAPTKKKD